MWGESGQNIQARERGNNPWDREVEIFLGERGKTILGIERGGYSGEKKGEIFSDERWVRFWGER